MIGVVNGMAQWLFAFPGRLSVTVSAADDLLDLSREDLAHRIWREVAAIANLADAMPAWQIVRERRATFAALPREEAKRPARKRRGKISSSLATGPGPGCRRLLRAQSARVQKQQKYWRRFENDFHRN